LGANHSILWRADVCREEFGMSDTYLFIFGLFTTILAVGPLIIAALSEQKSKKEK
jgi:hypothetical protein